jgi:hypothetical protein
VLRAYGYYDAADGGGASVALQNQVDALEDALTLVQQDLATLEGVVDTKITNINNRLGVESPVPLQTQLDTLNAHVNPDAGVPLHERVSTLSADLGATQTDVTALQDASGLLETGLADTNTTLSEHADQLQFHTEQLGGLQASSLKSSINGVQSAVGTLQSDVGDLQNNVSGLQYQVSKLEQIVLPRVFITSTVHAGNLGGLAGGDAICQSRANAANLGGQWKAWLSDSNIGPATRFATYTVPYNFVFGSPFVNSFMDLVNVFLFQPLTYNEFGGFESSTEAWTGTASNGQPSGASSSFNCAGWTSTATTGTFGVQTTSPSWTALSQSSCSTPRRLYCFEQ